MKNLKLTFGIVLALASTTTGISTTAMAQTAPCSTLKECQELRDSLKAQLKAVNAQIAALSPAPQVSYTEINGVKWSQVLNGKDGNGYQNLDLDGTKPINGIIQKSDATVACAALGNGWHLPTKAEFETLGSDYKKLPGIANNWFWSSSFGSNDPGGAVVFDGYYGSVGDYGYRYGHYAVVCVGGR